MHERVVADREWVLGREGTRTRWPPAATWLAATWRGGARASPAGLPADPGRSGARARSRAPGYSGRAGRAGPGYQTVGQLKQAVPLYERTLVERERADPDHPDSIGARADLTYAYRIAGRMKQALPQYERVVRGPGTGAGQLSPRHHDGPPATWPTPTSRPAG